MALKVRNIHKRKDGRFEGRYMQDRDANGKVKYGSVYAKTYTEVKEKLKIAISNIVIEHENSLKLQNLSRQKDARFSEAWL